MNAVQAESRNNEYATAAPLAAPVRGLAAFGAVLVGVATIAAAIGFGAASLTDPGGRPATAAAAGGDGNVSVTELTYAPGHSSGWHLHYGVHSVVVLGGTLTVYDEACVRQEYGVGASYLGGSLPHLARNEAPDELRVVVTSVYRQSATGGHGSAVPAPTGCDPR